MKSRLDPQKSVCCLIFQLNHSLSLEIAASLEAVGLTSVQLQALAELAKSSGLSTADLARLTCVTPQNMSLAVAKLVDRGCLVRKPHPTNARIHRLDLTTQGKRVLEKGLDLARRIERRTFSVLAPLDRRKLLESLRSSLAQFKPPATTDRISKAGPRHHKSPAKETSSR